MKRMSVAPLAVLMMLLWGAPLSAQYYFGRNKVHYDTFHWKILKTRHFDIYYYPEMRELAEAGAAFAENAYTRLENKFNHNIDHRIPLIFYSNPFHFQQTNTVPYLIPEGVGGFFEFLKGRVVIPSNGSLSDFRHVINHELVHVFAHSKVNRILKDRRKTNLAGLPLWFNEGLAEYWSEGWDSQAEMFIRDATLSGYVVSLSEMYRIYGTFLMYKEGQAICKFIAERFGEEKILQLIDNVWKADSFSEIMRLTLGVSYKEFDEMWLYDLKKKNYPVLENHDAPGMVTRRITKKGINTKPAFYAAKGERSLVFVANRIGYSNIYEMPFKEEGGEADVRVLIKGERTTEFEALDILASKIDINKNGQLAFVSKSKGKDAIYIYDLAARRRVKRFQFGELVTLYSPSWAPDGQRLAFAATHFGGARDLYTLSIDSGELTKLTNDLYDDRDPAWSPDGRAIAFSSDRTASGLHGAHNIFTYTLATGEIDYTTFGNHNDFAPAWSADGRSLAFCSDRDGVFNIWMLQNDTSQLQMAYNMRNDEASLASSSDLRVYPSALNGVSDLRRITNFTTGAFDPEWTDAGTLLFTAFEDFGFQIRELRDVQERYSKSEHVAADSVPVRRGPWVVEKLGGDLGSSTMAYKKRFNLDIAQSQINQDPIFGTSGGAQLAMSDMLGNQQYYFLIYNTAQNSDEFLESFNLAVTRVDLNRRANTAFGAYHLAGRYYNRVDGFFTERRIGGFGAISYPLSVFKRLEGSVNIRSSDKEWSDTRRRKAMLVSNFVSLVKDNSLWGPSGPVDGERFNLTVGNTIDVQHSNVNFYTIIADYRKYFRLGTRTAYALRLQTQVNEGKEATPFYFGGSWDLRLYRRWSIWGEKLFLLSNEVRFPFIDNFSVRFPFGGLGFSSIRGAAFLDMGNAWDERPREMLGSFGLGLRLQFGGLLVLRYDFGKQFYVDNLDSNPGWRDFHIRGGTRHQFFFGWDF